MPTTTANAVKIDFTRPYVLSIDGQAEAAANTFDVLNPATNAVLAQAPAATIAQMEAAIEGARRAFPGWAALGWDAREVYLNRYADALEAHKDEMITLLTLEQGKPRHSMATGEVEGAIYWMREVAKRRIPAEVLEDNELHTVEIQHTPLGVVGAITPWNVPVLLGLWKVAFALMTGNTVVLKPSPYTPLTSLRFGEIALQVLPRGVLNIVSGGNELGELMTGHPHVAKISFTGSTATGRRVMASGASNLKRLTLELGGNDAAIVLPDADYKAIIPTLVQAAFDNSAQLCIAIKRLYVHSSIHAEFVREFVAYAKTKTVGDGMDPKTDFGPIQNRMQYDKLVDLFEDVKNNDYRVVLGGKIDRSLAGNFVPLTVVDNPPETSRVVQEEPFGPILPILSYDDVDDAIARANASPFGLGGSVWGKDRDAAIAVANRLETGTVWVNEIHVYGVDIPFGGHKQSGLGVENGHEGLCEFTNTRTLLMKK
jgi:acyl-CoA reductase-like NAD-dependent aldehyde dehydrogenase